MANRLDLQGCVWTVKHRKQGYEGDIERKQVESSLIGNMDTVKNHEDKKQKL
jgi:hypothetical protein